MFYLIMASAITFPSQLKLYTCFKSVRERPYPDEDRVKGDPARDLATVHHVCETHLHELVDISKEMISIKVIEYLIFYKNINTHQFGGRYGEGSEGRVRL